MGPSVPTTTQGDGALDMMSDLFNAVPVRPGGALQHLLLGAELGDAPAMQHQHLVDRFDGAWPMCHDHHGAAMPAQGDDGLCQRLVAAGVKISVEDL